MRPVLMCVALLLVVGACADEPAEPIDEAEEAFPEAVVDPDDRPSVEIPDDEAPPGEVVVEDLIEGDGATVDDGDEVVTIHIVGVNWETGQRIVSSWDRGAPRTFAVEALIPGVREAIVGMAVGGRRQVVVPPEHGYGDDAPAGIGPGDTVVFVIDLVSVG